MLALEFPVRLNSLSVKTVTVFRWPRCSSVVMNAFTAASSVAERPARQNPGQLLHVLFGVGRNLPSLGIEHGYSVLVERRDAEREQLHQFPRVVLVGRRTGDRFAAAVQHVQVL